MKIALISQPFDSVIPPSMNSIGIWIYETSRQLAEKHQVSVYARRGISQRREIGGKVRTRYVFSLPNQWLTNLSEWASRHLNPKKPLFSRLVFYLEYILPIALDLRREHFDIVHLQNYSQFVPIIRAFNPEIKIVLHMRCEWLELLDYPMLNQRLQKTDLILGVSQNITNAIRRRFPQHALKCLTAYTGVDLETFRPPQPSEGRAAGASIPLTGDAAGNPVHSHPANLLFVGRITPEKGIHVLLEAFKQLAPHFPDLQLDLIGSVSSLARDRLVGLSDEERISSLDEYYDGSNYRARLEAILPAELKERVHYIGHIKYEQTIEYYQNADILINPALTEPFGRSLIEANACGVPTIASGVGGMTELIQHGKNGLLVEPGSAAELAQAIRTLLEDEPLRQRMGQAGRQFVLTSFSWEGTTATLLAHYAHLLHLPEVEESPLSHHPVH